MAIKENLSTDPWSSVHIINSDSNINNVIQSFEDNFEDLNHPFNKLPDSCEYLTKLTKQLENITLHPDLLKELSDKKESCMHQLLSLSNNKPDVDSEDFSELDEPLGESSVLRTLAPEKQALTKGELVELVKYDQLKITTEEILENNDASTKV